jgi:hypothetical protein
MKELHISYNDLMLMPLEELDWFYERQIKFQLERQEAQKAEK